MDHNTPLATAGPVPAVAMLHVTKRFPGVVANDDVTFTAERVDADTSLPNGARCTKSSCGPP